MMPPDARGQVRAFSKGQEMRREGARVGNTP